MKNAYRLSVAVAALLALGGCGIFKGGAKKTPTVGERVPIPDYLVPADAHVEIAAKNAAGYYSPDGAPGDNALKATIGRDLDRF